MSNAADELLAALERYQRDAKELAGRWRDPELYHAVSQHTEDIRRGCRTLPALSAAWVALLIAHAELAQAVWRSSQQPAPVTPADRERLLAAALARAADLQQSCMLLVQRPPGR